MRRFRVHINGRTYEVEVEELDQAATAMPARPNPGSAPAPAPQTTEPAATAVTPGGGVNEVTAPLPGLILEVRVQEGQRVAADDVVVVLEAMKMENELPAPRAGIVKEVRVEAGTTVNQGDVLVVLE